MVFSRWFEDAPLQLFGNIEKSSLLNGSAMLACVGTLCRVCLRLCLLRQVQCAPSRLFSGMCLPEPLMIACVTASLSHNCM